MRAKLEQLTSTPKDQVLLDLWHRFLDLESRLDWAWLAADSTEKSLAKFDHLASLADAIGHEHDRIVQRIAAQSASSWQGVTIKLLTWRRIVRLSELNLADADAALAFSVYLDALRLCPCAFGATNDAAIARLTLYHPGAAGE
ncbi:MAG TPA: hypothetical protein VM915_02830 [Verrucomicrobiae bacterium]|jgi:hypothetical protein|nr:hypothetical protein [Verrucomicrobiae bacterium]